MKCRAADRCGSILPLTTILTIGYKTFSLTLINVAAHSGSINTAIIRLNITLTSGLDETQSYSSCTSVLIRSQFITSAKTRQHNRPAGEHNNSVLKGRRAKIVRSAMNQWRKARVFRF